MIAIILALIVLLTVLGVLFNVKWLQFKIVYYNYYIMYVDYCFESINNDTPYYTYNNHDYYYMVGLLVKHNHLFSLQKVKLFK